MKIIEIPAEAPKRSVKTLWLIGWHRIIPFVILVGLMLYQYGFTAIVIAYCIYSLGHTRLGAVDILINPFYGKQLAKEATEREKVIDKTLKDLTDTIIAGRKKAENTSPSPKQYPFNEN